jgi:hypothetical protein
LRQLLKARGVLAIEDHTAKGQSNLYTIPWLAERMDRQTTPGTRAGTIRTNNRHVSSPEASEQRVRREHQEPNERRQHEREAEERSNAVSPEEMERFRRELLENSVRAGNLDPVALEEHDARVALEELRLPHPKNG